ncbi:Cupredoxin, partial [Thozetella sp. PMI_491]
HPIHMHGHDFWVVAQESATWDGSTDSFNLVNPPRRDVATLPGNGYLALAFRLDNPGTWLVHCHIAWHASQGLALEFVESESAISIAQDSSDMFNNVCASWNTWSGPFVQDDSGI